ncbi:MAG: hypothetical protein M0R46_16200 [Candidatus Muirbacterium halophilum]|nr:hypothetical protein [Candidatus Muirbacterium halophilum]MCK9477459.1 hypothetical protein [Candidatus Muirbacterium halophilum]
MIALIIGLILIDINSIILAVKNAPEEFFKGHIFYKYSSLNEDVYVQITTRTSIYTQSFFSKFMHFDFQSFVFNVADFIYNSLLYFINYFINFLLYFYLFFEIFLTKDNYNIKFTKAAVRFVQFISFLRFIKNKIKQFIQYLLTKKREIILGVLLILFFNSKLVVFTRELLIFLFYYFLSSINLTLHMIVWYFVKSAIIWTYINIPLWLLLIIIIYLIFLKAKNNAIRKQQKNHDSLKVFAKYDLPFLTMINGAPGVGKTRFMVALGLISSENFVDELEDMIHSIEMNYPEINFAKVINDPLFHQTNYPEHYYYSKLLKRNTSNLMTVPLAVLDPYTESLSHQLDFDYIRPNSGIEQAPFEEYVVLLISELDKEYNSHYSKVEVGEDGLHVFMGTSSHWFKRHAKIFADYQIPTQVPLNIRGNSEAFIFINDFKYKMPFLLNLYSIPFRFFYNIFDNLILKYESYKLRLTKDSMRKSKRIRKRYDYTFLYSFFRYGLYYFGKVLSWFDKFSYIKFYCSFTDRDGKALSKFKMNVNTIDEQYQGSRLYDSTFLSKSYEEKKQQSTIKSKWDTIPTWSSLSPSKEELLMVHSRFLESAFNVDTKSTKNKQGDDLHGKNLTDFKF